MLLCVCVLPALLLAADSRAIAEAAFDELVRQDFAALVPVSLPR